MHPSWHPDPTGRHELRYWDGSTWTDHVADQGAQSMDPLIPQPDPAPEVAPDQQGALADESQSAAAPRSDEHAEEQDKDHRGQQPTQVDQPEGHGAVPMAGLPTGAAAGFSQDTFAGITGDLIDGRYSEKSGAGVVRQNNRMLRVRVSEPFMARQGSMVAYQGNVSFTYQGGGAAKFLKKAFTGEGLSLMRVEGSGDVFLADQGYHVHILNLHDTGISISGNNVLAFSSGLDWNVERVKGGSITTGGLFNTTVRGTGWVAITTDGEPVVLNAGEAATFADTDAVVAWSAHLQTSLRSSMSAGALIGRGSGEALQVSFAGQGFVIVQPSEGAAVPPHNH
ncbi:MAG: AIM24 family protein [Nocardioides sp.]